jgi:pimeloyl-ACP methyl ester carboxylesterase
MSEIKHRRIATNGVNLHIAEAGAGPLVILLHGVPELWYSWRDQLIPLAQAGYHAVAPDLRGYGESDVPQPIESYSMRNMIADVVGLLDSLGQQKCVLVGHDWGANIAWACAEVDPERVAGVVALGVPYHQRTPTPPTEFLEKLSGDKFSFGRYFQKPGVAEAELEKDPRDSLRRFFYALSGDAPQELLQYLFFGKPATAGVLEGMPDPPTLPQWLTEADLDYYAQAFKRTGFRGALNRYRNLDRDWKELPQVGTAGVRQPVLFVGGKRDSAVHFGSFDPMIKAAPNLRRIVFLPDCGHWTQQERPSEVNAEIVAFLQREIRK